MNLLFRFDLSEWATTMAKFPTGIAETVEIYPEGTRCDITGDIVPPHSVHVALIGVSEADAAEIVKVLPDWTVS